MKKLYVSDLLQISGSEIEIELCGWLCAKRSYKKVVFLDICDSTGKIQAIVSENEVSSEKLRFAKGLTIESAVLVRGKLIKSSSKKEILANEIVLIGGVAKNFTPHPRSNIDIFDESFMIHMLNNRHIYLRNPKAMAILKFRDFLMYYIREWFHSNRFTAIDAPILTPVPLYEDGTALPINIRNEKIFLTQCVGYYLEAAVHAFEKVYNIGPSFRGEESRSKRHLMEYWHIKAEVAWANLEDIIDVVEQIITYLTNKCKDGTAEIFSVLGTSLCIDGLKTPFPRISYGESIKKLKQRGYSIDFGKSLGSKEEAELSRIFPGTPFWVTGIPRSIEPFPYVIDPSNPQITKVADLIASNGYGELLGTAEKISNLDMLDERLKEKGKFGDPRYTFVRDVHQVGCVPHAAFGMGVERLIRWLLNIPHVRDAIPFPRTFKRKVSP